MYRFQPQFKIGNREVGAGASVLVIAEAGVAHFGDMELARQLVDLAAKAGADVFKTQVFDVDNLISDSAQEWRDRLRSRNLSLPQFHELKKRCDDAGLIFMATAHDPSRIPWLEELGVPAVKVGSGERNNPEFLAQLAALDKPMIVSTGMYGESDVIQALEALRGANATSVALLHCVTSYPAPASDVNLSAMDALRSLFSGPVGYSDHTEDDLAVLSAVARGAAIIEKHITILRDVPNSQDWKVSAGPDDFPQLVKAIRRTEALIGHGRKEPAPSEENALEWALKSLVAARNLNKGLTITREDLVAKRPGTGVPASRLPEFIGRTLIKDVSMDEALSFEDLA